MLGKFILLFLVWIGLTNSLHYQELIVGAIVAWSIAHYFTQDDKVDLIRLAIKYLRFSPLFFKDLVLSNIEIAKIVLNPKLPINPAIIKLDTALENDFDKLLLANSITLTPGTITIAVDNNAFYIHVIDLKTPDKAILQKELIDKYEKILL